MTKRRIPLDLAMQCFSVGHSYAEMARRFGVSRPAVYYAINHGARYGESAANRRSALKMPASISPTLAKPDPGQ